MWRWPLVESKGRERVGFPNKVAAEMNFLRSLIEGVSEAWTRLSISARVQIGLAAALTLAILIGVGTFGSQSQFVDLHERLGGNEASEMMVWLSDEGIEFRQRDGGRTLQVPIGDVSRARVGLAGQNLPRSQGDIPGFEIFDTQSLMTNKWLQDTNFMRAVNGKLQRTLSQMDFVLASVVHINEAPDRLFSAEQKSSQASVTLKLTRPMTNEEVAAVLHTVSMYGGINLTTKDITITDTTGKVYKRPDDDDTVAVASSRLETMAEYATFYEKKIYGALSRMRHDVIVTASVDLDWDTIEKSERILGEEALEISRQTTESTTTTGESPPEGPSGLTANIPGGGVSPGGITTKSEEGTELSNFEIPETNTHTFSPAGKIKSLSVGVLVNDIQVPVESADGVATGEYTTEAPSPEDIANLEQLVRSTVGAGAQTVQVTLAHQSWPRGDLALAGVLPDLGTTKFWQSTAFRLVTQILLAILAMVVIGRLMNNALSVPIVEEEEVVEIPEATKEDMRRMEIASEVERLSREEPEAVAALIRSWMNEDD